MKNAGTSPAGLIVVLLLAIIAGAALVTAYGYSPASGLFPKFIGWVFLSLVVIEIFVQVKPVLAAKGMVRPTPEPESAPDGGRAVARELKALSWLGFVLALLIFAGFLVATPIFIFTFLRLSAGKTVREAVIVAALVLGVVYLLFMQLLNYRLYSGMLFGG